MNLEDSIESLENGTYAPSDFHKLVVILGEEIEKCEMILKDEMEKRKRYKVQNNDNLFKFHINSSFLYLD